MIKGLGTDLVDVARMALKIANSSFLKTAFTDSEIEYCQDKKRPPQHFAARFAAKEAYM
jgi:holo-[acyl-carrier protein] synthase